MSIQLTPPCAITQGGRRVELTSRCHLTVMGAYLLVFRVSCGVLALLCAANAFVHIDPNLQICPKRGRALPAKAVTRFWRGAARMQERGVLPCWDWRVALLD